MTLEEQFARLVADVAQQQIRPAPNLLNPTPVSRSMRTRTVYSVGEAVSQRGQAGDAKLGAGSIRDSGARR